MKLINTSRRLDFSYRFGWSLITSYYIFGMRVWSIEEDAN